MNMTFPLVDVVLSSVEGKPDDSRAIVPLGQLKYNKL